MKDRDIIERRRAEYVDAFNRQDIRTMTGYVAADIDGIAPSRPAIEVELLGAWIVALYRLYKYGKRLIIRSIGGRPVHLQQDEQSGLECPAPLAGLHLGR